MSNNKLKNLICKIPGCDRKAFGSWCSTHEKHRDKPPEDIKVLHGLTKSPEFNCWNGMMQRCNNPKNPGYKNYGGRGITVDKAWFDIHKFRQDMGPRPSRRHSIERMDVNGNYEPSNCCWATPHQQAINKRRSSRNTSGYIGVNWSSQKGRWCAEIASDKKKFHIGFFEDPKQAAWYRDQFAIQIHGETASLNFEYL